MRFRASFLVMIVPLALAGCMHRFAPGPGMSATSLEPEAAQCRLMARGGTPGFSFGAQGSERFVATATAAAAVAHVAGALIQQGADFNDCMLARGWQIADESAPVRTAPVAAVASSAPTVPTAPATTIVAASAPAVVPPQAAAGRRKLGVVALPLVQYPNYVPEMVPPRGVIVTVVQPDGAAAAAGLRPGDVMLAFGPSMLMQIADLQSALAPIPASGAVAARVWREGKEFPVTLNF